MGSARRHTRRWGVLAAAGALLLLAGCGGSDDSASGGGTGEMAVPAAAAPQRAADTGGTSDAAGTASGSAAGNSAANAPDLPRALIRTAEMTVRVDDVAAAARSAQELARAAGGTTTGDNRYGTGGDARADLELKVAPDRLDGALAQFSGLGEEVRRTSSTQDVTEDVADIDVRVRSMQASIARVRAILARADKIGDVVAVEGELSRRTTELEALQTKQRALAGQTALATVTLHLIAKDVAVAAAPEKGGFLGGLQDGWEAFSAAVGWVLTALGALLPFLIVLVPLAFAVRWFLTRRRPTTAPEPPPAPAA